MEPTKKLEDPDKIQPSKITDLIASDNKVRSFFNETKRLTSPKNKVNFVNKSPILFQHEKCCVKANIIFIFHSITFALCLTEKDASNFGEQQ